MYYFQHPKHTAGLQELIGEDEFQAAQTLTGEYGIPNDDIIPMMLDGFVWQVGIKPLVQEAEPHPYSISNWFAQRYA